MIIEKLKTKDIAKYKSLIDDCFGNSNEIDKYNYNENNPNYYIVIAKDANQIVGSITFYCINLFTFSFQPTIEMFNVCVKQSYRGRKIAKQMFEFVINYATTNNYKSINLTCLDTAYDAHYLYESLKFKKTNSIKYNLLLQP